MSDRGLAITAGLLQGIGNYYDTVNQARRQKRQDAEDKEDRDYTTKERKKKDLADLAANFDDINWQLSTTPEQRQTALIQYNKGAAEVGLPQRQMRDLVPEAMLDDTMKLKQAGYNADQTKVFLAKTYGNDRLQQFLGRQMMPSVAQTQPQVSAGDLANASTQQAPASAAAPGAQVSTPQYPAYLSSNYLGGLDTGSQSNQVAPVSAVAGSTQEVGQQPSSATESTDTLSAMFAPSSNAKTVAADRKMLGNAVTNGTMSNKDAVDWWSKNHPDIQTPDELFLLKPKPSVTNQANKVSVTDKNEARKYYRQMRQQAMQGKVSKDEWYSDTILKVNKFPGLSPAAQLSQDRTEQAMTLAQAASERASEANTRANAASARAAAKAANGGSGHRGSAARGPKQMSSGNADKARMLGFGSAAIMQGPAEVLNNIGVMVRRGQIKRTKRGDIYTTPEGQRAVQEVNTRYGGGSQQPGGRLTSFKPSTEKQLLEVARAYNGSSASFVAAVKSKHPGFNNSDLRRVYNSAKGRR